MSTPQPVAAVPMYVELAPAGSTLVAGTAGALLHGYLGILAYYFQQPGADCSSAGINAALGNLPGLVMQDIGQEQHEVTVPPSSIAGALATVLASQWGAVARSPKLLSLVQPMVDVRAYDASLLVLQRPANKAPVLESLQLSLRLQEPTSLSVASMRTSCTVSDDQLASSLAFVGDMSHQGRVADLATTRGYFAIPLS